MAMVDKIGNPKITPRTTKNSCLKSSQSGQGWRDNNKIGAATHAAKTVRPILIKSGSNSLTAICENGSVNENIATPINPQTYPRVVSVMKRHAVALPNRCNFWPRRNQLIILFDIWMPRKYRLNIWCPADQHSRINISCTEYFAQNIRPLP